MASFKQIAIFLILGWAALFALGWQARAIFGRPTIKRFKFVRRRKYRVVRYNFDSRA